METPLGLALNSIARCGFGLDINAFKEPDHELFKAGTEAIEQLRPTNWFQSVMFHLFAYLPGIDRILPFVPAAFDKLYNITKKLMKMRESEGIHNEDFLNRLMELVKAKNKDPDSPSLKALSQDSITGQGIVFFLAGYETTANTLSTFFYHMGKNPDVQERLREEIDDVMAAHDGKINRETIADMSYLDAVLNENLRIYGPVHIHQRVCIKDCEVGS